MTLSAAMNDSQFDLSLKSGRIRVRRIGSSTAPLVLFVHGLSAHMHSFDHIIEKVANSAIQLVALDLRGRGRSEISPTGSYGLDAHARDVLEAATLLGADRFDLVGWSMGALIGICIAQCAPERLGKLVLIDHAGKMDPAAIAKIEKGLTRLDMTVEQPTAYIAAVRAASGITPWTPFWEHYYQYELGPVQQGYQATTNKAACMEDLADAMRIDWSGKWSALTMPTLLIRCQIPIGGGFVVPEAVRDALRKVVPNIKTLEVNLDHYAVMTDEATADAIKKFLGN
ncbi:MAG TPA: alpha/beta hydrolase [Burkholderiaceae bacterium]|jgi:pimeloyl-ACP methyl ester carboxylesterase|nr:alpha/beta hydrolase [Burkholderiaceae bacterium]